MMPELRSLYQEVIIQHGSKPKHFVRLENPTCIGKGHNPLCGDDIILFLKIDANVITEVSFQGQGCAISMASASLMCEALTSKTLQEAEELFQLFHALLTLDAPVSEQLGKLVVLSGVREFPARVKCATLAWHTLQNALQHNEVTASTE